MTETLTLEEEGALVRLTVAAWRRGGALPTDPVVLGVLLQRTLGSRWRRFQSLVDLHFPLDRGRACEWLVVLLEEQRRRRERRAQYQRPAISRVLREAVYSRDGWKCVECGATERLSLDHIKPYSDGGEDTEANLRTLCVPCNSARGTGA